MSVVAPATRTRLRVPSEPPRVPYAVNGDVSIRYEVDGDGPAVVFCGDAGLGAWQFGWQHGAVAGPHRAITPEPRGIGQSDAPSGPYSVGDLASDLDAVLADAGVRNAHVVGYGLGGAVALHYALTSNRPASLVLLGTAATGDAFNPDALWADPDDPAAVESSLDGLFSARFREERPDVLDRIADWRVAEDASPAVFDAQRAALDRFDVGDRLYEITTPALVLHGGADAVCPASYGETLAEGLPRGEYHEAPDAGHLVGIEASAFVNDELRGWLDEHADADRG